MSQAVINWFTHNIDATFPGQTLVCRYTRKTLSFEIKEGEGNAQGS